MEEARVPKVQVLDPVTELPEGQLCFTTDWFTHNVPHITASLAASKLDLQGPLRMLEIGSWEGLSTTWFLRTLPGVHVTCVDTWDDEHYARMELLPLSGGVWTRFCHNTTQLTRHLQRPGACVAVQGLSHERMCQMVVDGAGGFDVVYVDGSHDAADVFLDAGLAFKLCRPGGVVLFDDYLGGHPDQAAAGDVEALKQCPKPALDGFLASHRGRCDVLHRGYQLHVQKRP